MRDHIVFPCQVQPNIHSVQQAMREQAQHQKLYQREFTLCRDLENDQAAEQDGQKFHICLKLSIQ
jgi:hypothetical protein